MGADATVIVRGPESERNVGDRIAQLTSQRMEEAAAAVSFALAFDDD